MSRAVLKGNASGTGTVTLSSPNTNDNYTLELPTDAGTVLNTASDIEAQVKTATSATGSAPIFSCRAWVNFNGTGTVAIRASGNVSSITDNGTGNYTVNFATAMPDANFAASFAAGDFDSADTSSIIRFPRPTTTNFGFQIVNFDNQLRDRNQVYICIFR